MMKISKKNRVLLILIASLCSLVSVIPFTYAEGMAEEMAGVETASAPETEKASLSRDSELREAALSDSKVVLTLPAQGEVEVLERTGAWAHVKTAEGQYGYVRLLNLRTISQNQRKGDSGVKSLISTFRTGSSGQSVATGVKGMSAEQLEKGKADRSQLKILASYQADGKKVKKEAKANGLKEKKVKALANPQEEQ